MTNTCEILPIGLVDYLSQVTGNNHQKHYDDQAYSTFSFDNGVDVHFHNMILPKHSKGKNQHR